MKPSDLPSITPRLPTLDGIRGLASVLVLCHNVQLLQTPNGLLARAVETGFDRGWVGVQLFFVLSVYLITGILLDTKTAPNHFSSFFTRRALRIFPLYYLTLVLLLLIVFPMLVTSSRMPQLTLESQLPFWLYYSNWSGPDGPPQYALSHFWSLAIEEQFYWLWPFVLYRLSLGQTLGVCLGAAVAALLIRVGMVAMQVNADAICKFSFCRMDALTLGGAAAAAMRLPGAATWIAARRGRLLALTLGLAVAGLLVTRGFGRTSPLTQTLGYSLLLLIFALFVGLAAHADFGPGRATGQGAFRWLRSAPLRFLGKYSYGACTCSTGRSTSCWAGPRWRQ